MSALLLATETMSRQPISTGEARDLRAEQFAHD
jgi:hypothetical protein